MFFFMKSQNEEEKEQLLSLKKNASSSSSSSSSSIRFFITKVTACAVLLAGIGTLGKINVYDRQQQRFESSGVKQQLAFLGEADGLPSCGPYVDDNLRTKLLHNGEEVQDAAIGYKECEFFSNLGSKAKLLGDQPSECVAPNTVITTYTSGDDFYHNLGLVVKNLKDQDCFMKRFLVVCADSACSEQATADGYNNIEFPEDSSNSDTSYGRFTWMKQKISLGVVGSGVNMFMVDADVVLFSVPETNSFLSQTNVDGMFQEDYMDYHGAYTNGPEWTKQYLDGVHAGASNFNSGQMWYRASERASRWIQTSLAHGVMCSPNCGLEQNVLHDAAKQAPVGDTELGVEPYALNIQPLPITYATFCSRTTDILHDWEVVKHMGEWKTLHMCCAGYKYDGMGNAIEKRKCAMQTPGPSCVEAGMGKEERWDYVAPAETTEKR
jgi:hypothetical protein